MPAALFERGRLGFHALLLLLYGVIGYASYGYDDEMFNIIMVEKLGFAAVGWVQTIDVHPPGSYLYNWGLYALLGDWSLVRLAISLQAAGAVIWLVEFTRRHSGARAALLMFLLVGLNPAMIMWCTGLRWYAILVPLACLAMAPPRLTGWIGWTWLFAMLLAMAFTGYITLFLAPGLLMLHWLRDPAPVRDKLAKVAVLSGVGAAAYAWQAHVFLSVHMADKSGQSYALFKSLQSLAIAEFGNQGLFPLSLPAGVSALGVAGFFAIGLWQVFKARRLSAGLLAYGLACLLLVATGLAGKLRNFVVVEPLKGLAMTEIEASAGSRRLLGLCLAAILIGNAWGIWNVATHTGTTKNSWNTPTGEVLANIRATSRSCNGNVLVLAHEAVLTNWLERQGYRTISPYGARAVARKGVAAEAPLACLIALKTYRGSVPAARLAAMYGELDAVVAGMRMVYRFSRDDQAQIKRLIDKDFPEYAVEMIVLRDVRLRGDFTAWRAVVTPQGVPRIMYH